MTIHDFKKMKREQRKISLSTCYDFSMARILSQSQIDAILVGDSVAMVMHGFPSTLYATVEMLSTHISMVSRGAPSKWIIGDMPFGSFRKGVLEAMDCVERFMKAGAHAVKLEGVTGHEAIIRHIVQSGIPVMGHVGFTPQSVHQLGGARVQGTNERNGTQILREAKALEDLGCFSIVLECVPETLADEVTKTLTIPTIGIGAGVKTDGQILVLHDFLGMNTEFKPKFLRHYLNGEEIILKAINEFDSDVKSCKYPSESESYHGNY